MPTPTKTCPVCGQTKPLEKFHGRLCIVCACLAYRAANREKCLANWRARYAANPEKHRARVRAWTAANREKVRSQKRAWVAANREKVRSQKRARTAANREMVRSQKRAWVAANREKVRSQKRARRAANPEKALLESVRNYLSKSTNIPSNLWPDSLVQAWAANRTLKRLIKTQKQKPNET